MIEIRDSKGKVMSNDLLDLFVYQTLVKNDRKLGTKDGYYCVPGLDNCVDFLSQFVEDLIFDSISWDDVIGKICKHAALGETSSTGFMYFLNTYLPYIEVCLEFKGRGYKLYRHLTLY